MQSDAALMQQLQGLAGSAQGRMQALQAAVKCGIIWQVFCGIICQY
jgi:hypothetical protein